MSETIHYAFLPWFRTGLGTAIPIDDTGDGPDQQRASLPVALTLNTVLVEPTPGSAKTLDIELYGPGDVVGFDQRVVLRTDPRNNVGDFEPNYLPAIEFGEEDFPWRLTPARRPAASAAPRLRPWIALIVLKETEFTAVRQLEDEPLPSIEVLRAAGRLPLPDPAYSMNWAHVQVTSHEPNLTEAQLLDYLDAHPERVVSRLVCPRRLEPGALYHAFVVPAFKNGVASGLGMVGTAKLLEPAWTVAVDNAAGALKLPYYYRWEFRTGQQGDFEYLVRLLVPREIDSRVGIRAMDCAHPGYAARGIERVDAGVTEAERHVLGLEGAMRALDSKRTPWTVPSADPFQADATPLLNMPAVRLRQAPSEPPVIAPPLYGSWHIGQREIMPHNPPWFQQLNLDPRYRATAGFGALVLRDQQEDLMEAAWLQVGAIEAANALLRQAQLAKLAAARLHRDVLTPAASGELLWLTAPVHGRLLTAPPTAPGGRETIQHHLAQSPIPAAALCAAFRRIARPQGPLRRRQQSDARGNRPDLLTRLNNGDVRPAGDAPKPGGSPGLGDVSDRSRPWWARGWIWKVLRRLPLILLIAAVVLYLVVALLQGAGLSGLANPLALAAAALVSLAALLIGRLFVRGLVADSFREERLTPAAVAATPARPNFVPAQAGVNPDAGGSGGADHPFAAGFRVFAQRAQQFLAGVRRPERPGPVDLARLRQELLAGLDPKRTVVAQTNTMVRVRGLRPLSERLDTIMAAPEFPQPMYAPLRDISQELLLPGLQYVPQNTLGLLQTNSQFVQSYMAGLNVAMADELLWREYPTDQRGTYFRQFWDVRGVVPPEQLLQELRDAAAAALAAQLADLSAEEREARLDEEVERQLVERLKDIRRMHLWKSGGLGSHTGGADGQPREKLVLLVRGDVLKKYPNTVVYAARAQWELVEGAYVRRPILDQTDQNTRTPVFTGTLQPDITFLGFELTAEQAKGSPQREDNLPGWFFVLEERVGETRFGLDEPMNGAPPLGSETSWDKLTWGHVGGLPPSGYIDATAPSSAPGGGAPTWNADAATMARITFQKPVRIAVHGERMIPELPQPTP